MKLHNFIIDNEPSRLCSGSEFVDSFDFDSEGSYDDDNDIAIPNVLHTENVHNDNTNVGRPNQSRKQALDARLKIVQALDRGNFKRPGRSEIGTNSFGHAIYVG